MMMICDQQFKINVKLPNHLIINSSSELTHYHKIHIIITHFAMTQANYKVYVALREHNV